MTQSLKERAGTIYTVVEAVILGVSVCMLAWTSAKLVTIGEMVSMHGNQIIDIARRVEKLETAALLSATVPGELKALNIQISGVLEGQRRIERTLEEHAKEKP